MTQSLQRGREERGSALLIVFLFAAIIAIYLYMEMPSVAFEAKRAKEQLLVDRGHEYAHAVKLYYRKFRSYPASIDALENTNRMRFLRHRYKDPMTGDDKWRLLHAGPGGQLTDSKVNPIGLNANGNTNGQTSTTGTTGSAFGNNSSNTFATTSNSGAGSGFNAPNAQQLPDNTGTPGMVAGVPQRPPEMPVNGGAAVNPANGADPTQSLLQPPNGTPMPQQVGMLPVQPTAPVVTPATPAQFANPGQFANQGQAANGTYSAGPMQGVQGLFTNPNPVGAPANPAGPPVVAGAPGTPGAIASAGPSTPSAFGNNATTTTQSSGMGVIQSGGIAGVASLAKGSSIKLVNDQSDYSLWEFYYDPTKDTSILGQSGINPMQGVNTPNGLAPNAPGNNSSGFSNSSPSPTNPTNGATPFTSPVPNPTTPQQQQP